MTIGRIIAQVAILTGETVAVAAANYATNTAIDFYAHPDLKDCKTEEEKAEKVEKFNKTMSVVKPIVNVIEAGLIGAGCGIAIEAIDKAVVVVDTDDVDDAEEAAFRSNLIGCNYLI